MPLGRLKAIEEEYVLPPAQLPELSRKLADLIEQERVRIAVADNIGYYSREELTLRGSMRRNVWRVADDATTHDDEEGRSFWLGCLAGIRVLAICSNGDIKGCPSHPRCFVVGNVRDTPFAEIWADAPGKFGYNTAFQKELLQGECAACPFGKICRAGCMTMAHCRTGTIYDNPFCVQRARDETAEVDR